MGALLMAKQGKRTRPVEEDGIEEPVAAADSGDQRKKTPHVYLFDEDFEQLKRLQLVRRDRSAKITFRDELREYLIAALGEAEDRRDEGKPPKRWIQPDK